MLFKNPIIIKLLWTKHFCSKSLLVLKNTIYFCTDENLELWVFTLLEKNNKYMADNRFEIPFVNDTFKVVF
jgi:hypothetical protein